MQCPRCRSELRPVIYEADIEVDECPGCRGVWLDGKELEKIQETIEHDYSDQLQRIDSVALAYEAARQKIAPAARCPKCAAEMVVKEYGRCSQIIIDVCAKCEGVWLDRGELQALEVFFEREHPELRQQAGKANVRRGFFGSLLAFFRGQG